LSKPSTATHSTTSCAAWQRYHPPVVDEIGYLPIEGNAANLPFALIARTTNAARSSSPPTRGFEAWARSSATPCRRRSDRPPHPSRPHGHAEGQELLPARYARAARDVPTKT
jgi:hypothetical protein